MARLEDLTKGALLYSMLPGAPVTVVDAGWQGSDEVELTYKDAAGELGHELLYRDREPTLEVVTAGLPWSFAADGAVFRLAAETNWIRFGHLFDRIAVQARRALGASLGIKAQKPCASQI